MDRKTLETLRSLGYSPRWIALGHLPPTFLQSQLEALSRGEDLNTEHYRYAAFKRMLAIENLTDEFVQDYVALAELDPNRMMATAALQDLLSTAALTEEQFKRVAASSLLGEARRAVLREELLRLLRGAGPTAEVVACCIQDGDATVHEALLARSDLPLKVLEALATTGRSRRVRNIAAAELKRRSRGRPDGSD